MILLRGFGQSNKMLTRGFGGFWREIIRVTSGICRTLNLTSRIQRVLNLTSEKN